MKHYFIFFLLLAFFFSCKKEVGVKELDLRTGPENNEYFSEVWSHSFSISSYLFPLFVDIIGDNVIYTSEGYFKTFVTAFNKSTGDTTWHKEYARECEITVKANSTLLMNINHNLVAINSLDGTENWSISSEFLHHMIFENGKIYAVFGDDYWGQTYYKLYEVDLGSGSQTLLSTVNSIDMGVARQRIKSMSYWKHPNGNDILFMQSNCDVVRCSKLYALDITNDSIYCSLTVGAGENTNKNHPIEGNLIYINQGGSIAQYNLLTKAHGWWRGTSGGSDDKNSILLNGGFIYVSNGNNDDVEKMDKTNGNKLHDALFTGGILGVEHQKGNHMRVIGNELFYSTSSTIAVFDLTSTSLSKTLKKGEYLNDKKMNENFIPSFDVDPTTGYIYTGWRGTVACIKPN